MYPHVHPYDLVPARPLSPPEELWSCRKCRKACDAWHCQICREVMCGFDDGNPVEAITLTEGRKLVCRDCAAENVDDCRARDLSEAVSLLALVADRAYGASPAAGKILEDAIEYLERELSAEQNVGVAEFYHVSLAESVSACECAEPWNCERCRISTEAHDYTAIYVERFGGVANA